MTDAEQRLTMTYDEWYDRVTVVLLGSDIPRAYVEDCLTNRPTMQEFYRSGFAVAEVLMFLSKRYREQMAQRKAERARLNAEAREWMYRRIVIAAIVVWLAVMGVLALIAVFGR
jgi:hypothetical protein